jgi:hypothetical protein
MGLSITVEWFGGLGVAVDGADCRKTGWGRVGMRKVIDGLIWPKDPMLSSYYYV